MVTALAPPKPARTEYANPIEKAKADALAWLRDRFEIPEALEFPKGHIKDSMRCPIARLLTAARYEAVEVHMTRIVYYMPEGERVRVSMPKSVQQFPQLFDNGAMPELIAHPTLTEALEEFWGA